MFPSAWGQGSDISNPSRSATALADPPVARSQPQTATSDFVDEKARSEAEVNATDDATGSKERTVRFRKTELIGFAVTTCSLLLVMFLLYLYVFSGLTGVRNQNQLLHSLTGNPRAIYSLAEGHAAANGQPVAILNIPILKVHEAVIEGTTPADLQMGPGLASGTSVPGAPGLSIIAGKRVSFGGAFSAISTLKPGDKIDVSDGAGNFTFAVTSVSTLSTNSISAPQFNRSWLSLVTSNSPWLPTARTIVIARNTGRPVALNKVKEGASSQPVYALPNLSGDPGSGPLALLWTVLLLALIVLMVASIRRWRQPWISWVLASPILLACALFASESLARCLPSTL
jgi:sortase A